MRDVAHLRRLVGAAAIGATTSLLVVQTGQAQGFSVYEHGACAMARGGATVAVPCNDGSAIFFNPAGIAGSPGAMASLGTTVVAASGEFAPRQGDVAELQNDPIIVPHGFLTYGVSDRLTVGMGLYVPYGLGTKWPTEFVGHHLGFDNNLQSIYVQPTAAYQISKRIAIGAGLTFVNAAIELNQRLDISEQKAGSVPLTALGAPPGQDFGEACLDGSGTGIGGNFGLRIQATDRLSFGTRFTTAVSIDYEGTAEFAPIAFNPGTWTLPAGNPFGAPAGTPVSAINLPAGNPFGVPAGTPLAALISGGIQQAFTSTLSNQTIAASLSMPAQFVAGLGFQASPALLLLADYQWTDWSSFDQIMVDFEKAPDLTRIENFEDTYAFRFGTEYAPNEALRLRAGMLTHNAAAPDETVTPLLPEGDRMEYTIGAGLRLTSALELNAAYQYLNQKDREGRVQEAATGQTPTVALNSGVYRFNAHLFGVTLTARF